MKKLFLVEPKILFLRMVVIVALTTTGCMQQQIINSTQPVYRTAQATQPTALEQLAQAAEAEEDCGVASLECFDAAQDTHIEIEVADTQDTPTQPAPPPVQHRQPPPPVAVPKQQPTDQGQYYGIPIRAEQENIVFVLDTSGSMAELNERSGMMTPLLAGTAIELGRRSDKLGAIAGILMPLAMHQASKLKSAKKELIKAIEALAPETRFNIITFGETPLVWQSELLTANILNKNQAINFIKGLQGRGSTPALAALRQAFNFTQADTIFFVSDGIPTDSSPQRIINEVHTINHSRSTKINTIGLGGDQDTRFMTQLAGNNGGSYVRR